MKLNKYFIIIHKILSIFIFIFFLLFAISFITTTDIFMMRICSIRLILTITFICIYFYNLRKNGESLLVLYTNWCKTNNIFSLSVNVINDIVKLNYIFKSTSFDLIIIISFVTPIFYTTLWFSTDMKIFESIIYYIILFLSTTCNLSSMIKMITTRKNIINTFNDIYQKI